MSAAPRRVTAKQRDQALYALGCAMLADDTVVRMSITFAASIDPEVIEAIIWAMKIAQRFAVEQAVKEKP